MSARVLLNLLNALRKSDKMRVLPSIKFLFPNEFEKFKNTGARKMLGSVYHMTLKLHFRRDKVKILPFFTQRYTERHYAT